jgi:hypothetical protein
MNKEDCEDFFLNVDTRLGPLLIIIINKDVTVVHSLTVNDEGDMPETD